MLIAVPWFAGDYLVTVLILIFYFAYVGQAWNVMMGFAGQLSLGHALYVGLAGYLAALLFKDFGVGPWLGFLAAVPVAMLAGAIIGFLALRFGVTGVYFAILTIAFAEFARIGFDHLAIVNGSGGLFLPVASQDQTTSGCCAARRSCSTTSCSPPRSRRSSSAACCSRAAWATSGWRSARTRRRRAPPASTPSATRWRPSSSPPA